MEINDDKEFRLNMVQVEWDVLFHTILLPVLDFTGNTIKGWMWLLASVSTALIGGYFGFKIGLADDANLLQNIALAFIFSYLTWTVWRDAWEEPFGPNTLKRVLAPFFWGFSKPFMIIVLYQMIGLVLGW